MHMHMRNMEILKRRLPNNRTLWIDDSADLTRVSWYIIHIPYDFENSLEEATEAMNDMSQRNVTGKVVLIP